MSEVGYLGALVLGALFAWAGTAKLLRRDRTIRSFRQLRLPAAAPLAVAVPLLELGLAVGLVVTPRPAAIVSLVTLAAFTAVLARTLRSGLSAGCGCFGSPSTGPVSTRTLVRNAFLVVAAGLALAGRPAVPGLAALVIASAVVAIAAVVLALADLRQVTGRVWAMELPRR